MKTKPQNNETTASKPQAIEPAASNNREARIQVNCLEEPEDVTVVQFEREPLTDLSFGF